ncbi:MAG: hypothetical protein KQA41_03535 [Candidatus Aenigmarchaeota archaeon]|nr:hypothetical protein [Candidatus Aenigmarchaeota archaeon]MBU5689268.1 hypothetical protein [Candidatus Aenigmarchaeota archaeon]
MVEEILSIVKWLPLVTIFFLFVSLVYHLEVNRLLLFVAIVLDIIGYLARFED